MLLLPLDYVEIYTGLTPEEVRQKLCTIVQSQRLLGMFFEKSTKPYWGTINGSKFQLSRKIWYRNSALPIISGEIHPDGKGSRINIVMHLHWPVMVFMAYWLGMAALMFVNVSSDLVLSLIQNTAEKNELIGVSIPAGFLIYGYFLIILLPYKMEAGSSRAFLFRLFEMRKRVVHERFLGLSDFQIFLLFLLLVLTLVICRVLSKLIFGFPS